MAMPLRWGASNSTDLDDRLVGSDVDSGTELLGGEVVERAPLSVSHGAAVFGLMAFLEPFRRQGQGWLFAARPELAFGPSDRCRPLLAGWIRHRIAEVSAEAALRIAPDYVVDLESTPRTPDEERRLRIYGREGVGHLWLVEPDLRRLIVLRHTTTGYLEVARAAGSERVFAEPFDAVELSVAGLFGDDDEED
ncbi:MAG: Uma2 family endonuclease [Polyangiaceae bacterium]|nr:Uma2 family endonuclease [Polyangiaceae bacterium]